MKIVFALTFVLISFFGLNQYPDRVDVDKIIQEIITPLKKLEIDQVISRTVFPFRVGDSNYTSPTFRSSFSKIFIDGYAECLSDPENYQVAMPGDDHWCLAVCMVAPEGFEATVFSFVKKEGVWKLEWIDLQ
jgi:hypothetical protein